MASSARDGLAWDENSIFSRPIWTREPDLEAIELVCRKSLPVNDQETCQASFYTQGAFNKIYLVQTSQQQFLIRITLPVCPHTKTRGEVTTLRFLRRKTTIPVPEVIAFDDSADNEIGFEWILMELMPGVSAYKKWRTMTPFQKVAFVQRIAEFQAQILQHTFSGIGTLTTKEDKSHQEERPGEMVFPAFFMGEHYNWEIPHGPFRSSYDWLFSYLQAVVKEHETALAKAEDEDEKEDAILAISVGQRLMQLLPKIFPPLQAPPERSVIRHDDLSLTNILVDDQGTITALIDWESVSAMPLWTATQLPRFLREGSREEEPKRDIYADASPGGADAASDEAYELDNEGKNELYWIHLIEYEMTQLKKVYTASMSQLRPGWNLENEYNTLKDDFFDAIAWCEGGIYLKIIVRWIDAVEKGQFPRLSDFLKA